MKKQRWKKIMALLITACLVFQVLGTTAMAEEMITPTITTFYVGGVGASDSNSGLSSNLPFETLAKAAEVINGSGTGNYHIIVQGDTLEIAGVRIGDGINEINVTITGPVNESVLKSTVLDDSNTSTVTGSAITSTVTGSAITSTETENSITSIVTGSAIVMRGPEYNGHIITVLNKATLTLGDSLNTEQDKLIFDGGSHSLNTSRGSIISVNYGGTLNVFSEVTLQNNYILTTTYPYGEGGGIFNQGTFSMYGGLIKNCKANYGGAIYNEGIFHLYGGIIDQIESNHGTVMNNRETVMEGGEIRNSTGEYAAGVLNNRTFTMSGGSIDNNHSARSGGGVVNYNDFTMTGGTISNNTAGNEGGGLINNATFTMTGGTIYGNSSLIGGGICNNGEFNLSGSASIPAGDNKANDVFLSKPIYITAPLSSMDTIAITPMELYDGNVILKGTSGILDRYHSLFEVFDTRFEIAEDGILQFTQPSVTYYIGGVGADDTNEGTSSDQPLATLEQAININNGGICTIIVQSDLEIAREIRIKGKIDIISNGGAWTISPIETFVGYSMFNVNYGTLTLGNKDKLDAVDTLIFDGKNYIFDIGCLIDVRELATLNINQGVTIKNFNLDYSIITNFGTFHMWGGSICDNTINYKYGGIVENERVFDMSQGSISNNDGLGVLNNNEGVFTMSGGIISENTCGGVDTEKTFVLSGDSVISSSSSYGVKLVHLYSSITLGGNLSSSESSKISVIVENYFEGRPILAGNETLIQDNYQKFLLEDISGDYEVGSDGTVQYKHPSVTYYVGGAGADDGNVGLDSMHPYATIQKAVDEIGTEKGVIILQSDIELSSPICIEGNVNLITDGSICTITRGDSFTEYSDSERGIYYTAVMAYINQGKLILGNTDHSGNDEEATLIFDGQSEKELIARDSIIRNMGVLEIYSGVSLRNNQSYGISAGAVYNYGYITMHGGKIENNLGSNAGGLYLRDNSSFLMKDGAITGNTGNVGGIYLRDRSNFTMEDGNITNNIGYGEMEGIGAVIIDNGSTFTMNEGNISGNTGMVGGVYVNGMNMDLKRLSVELLAKERPSDPSIFEWIGGTIKSNSGIFENILINGELALLKVSDNTLLPEAYKVTFLTNRGIGKIVIMEPLSGISPMIMTEFIEVNEDTNQLLLVYPIGMKILNSEQGYHFTSEDAAKIAFDNPAYGYNIEGCIGTLIEDSWITISNNRNLKYNGNAITVDVIVSDGDDTLVANQDYVVSYKNNINPGTATVIVEGKGDFAGLYKENFTIRAANQNAEFTPTPIPKQEDKDTIHINVDLNDEDINESSDKVTIPVPTNNLLEQISREGITNVNISVRTPGNLLSNKSKKTDLILEAEVIEAAKKAERNLSVTIADESDRERYTWSFNKDELTSSGKDITDVNLYLEINQADEGTEFEDVIGGPLEGDNTSAMVINFGHDGILPSQASVRIYVGDQEGVEVGEKIYLYHYNHETGKLETLPYSSHYVVDEEGYITINILHCSDYVVLPEEADASRYTSLRKQITVTSSANTLFAGGSVDDTAMIEIDLPVTLEFVNSLEDKTSGSAIGGVVATYQSGNEKVATVDKEGKITAKKAGKVTIYTTITLYSKKTKTFKTTITVKKPYITIVKSTDSIKVGERYNFEAKAYGLKQSDIIWLTTKKSKVVINKSTGRAIAKSKGTDYVVVQAGEITKKIKVVVK